MKPLFPLLTGFALVAFQGPTLAQTGDSQDIRNLRRELEATRRELAELKDLIRSLHETRRPATPATPKAPAVERSTIRAVPAPRDGAPNPFRGFDGPMPFDATMEKHLRESLRAHFEPEQLERILQSIKEHRPKRGAAPEIHFFGDGEGGEHVFRWERAQDETGRKVTPKKAKPDQPGSKKKEKRRAIAIIGHDDGDGPMETREIEIEIEGDRDLSGSIQKLLEEHGVRSGGEKRFDVRVVRPQERRVRVLRSPGEHGAHKGEHGERQIHVIREKGHGGAHDVDVRVEKHGEGHGHGTVRIRIVGPDGQERQQVIEFGGPQDETVRRLRVRGTDGEHARPEKRVFRIEVDEDHGHGEHDGHGEHGEAGEHRFRGTLLRPAQLPKIRETLRRNVEPRLLQTGERLRVEVQPLIEKLQHIEVQPLIEKLHRLEGPLHLEIEGLKGKLEGLKLHEIEGLKGELEGLKLHELRPQIDGVYRLHLEKKEKEDASEKGASIYL